MVQAVDCNGVLYHSPGVKGRIKSDKSAFLRSQSLSKLAQKPGFKRALAAMAAWRGLTSAADTACERRRE